MSFELEKLSLDLGDTPIENIFISDYMPGANGNFVKVYLLGYRYALEGQSRLSNASLAKTLGLLESDVLHAWDYWEEQGIIKKEPIDEDALEYTVIFLNLKQLYIKNVYTTGKEESKKPKSLTGSLSDPIIAKLLGKVDFYMRAPVSYQQKMDVVQWITDYNMPPQIIEEAFYYTTEMKSIFNIRYVETVVRNWAEKDIRTMEEVEESYRRHDLKFYRFRKVMKEIGLGNKPYIASDFEMIQSWFEEYKYDMDVVLEACRRAANLANPNVNYINGVIKNWNAKGIKTVEDIATMDIKEPKKNAPPVKRGTTKFHNFDQRTSNYTEDQLEILARKKRESFRNNKEG